MRLELVKADKELFATYSTMYSQADIEMWYDFNKQLKDTLWTDECYFVMQEDKKIGGAIIENNHIRYPFLVTPYCDRLTFWKYLINQVSCKHVNGTLVEDTRTLLMLGYKPDMTGHVMCRPTDKMTIELADEFEVQPISKNTRVEEVAAVVMNSYKGGICNEINGEAQLDETIEDIRGVFDVYNDKNWSHVITEKKTNKIVAVCIAGTGDTYVHKYAEIADLCVLPEYRKKGLAKYMIANVTNSAYGIAPFVKLFVYVGNSAESIYREMGFIDGPVFTNMTKR